MPLKDIPKDQIIGLEPKHVTYVEHSGGRNSDCLIVKELVHLKDGRKIDNLRFFKDYKRPFWVTQKGRQTHHDKRDYEYVKHLTKYSCIQKELPKKAATQLGEFGLGPFPRLKQVARSPYLYGVDVTSSCLVKADYRDRYGRLFTMNRVAASDVETNVHSKDQEIICASITHRDRGALYLLRSWIGDIPDVEQAVKDCADIYIGERLKERGMDLEVYVVDTPAQIVMGLAQKGHEWKPDFVTFWNIDFDMSRFKEALERENVDPAQVFSDPAVPPEYRYFYYRRGDTMKVTASGKTMSINIEDRWNWVTHPASFQFIDSMPIYRNLRIADGKESSYALDYILDKVFDGQLSKLKFKETEQYKGLRWHEVMQKEYRLEYAVYNVFDSISLELLDEKTNDLASKITTTSGNSDYKNFNSNPKRLCDDMHFDYLSQDEAKVIGSSSDNPADELDKLVIGHDK